MATEKMQSKNWPGTQWQKKEPIFVAQSSVSKVPKPSIIFPKIKDLPISKELALSKPIQLPDMQYRAHNTLDEEQYAHLSTMIRTNIFPGCENNRSTSSYAQTFSNPYLEPNYWPIKSSKDFRRRKQGFSKRLEHDLEIKRIQAAWKEYFETQKQLIDWEEKAKSNSNSKPRRAAKPAPAPVPVKKKKPPPKPKPPPPPPPEEPVIPEPDMGVYDIFRSQETPEWAKGEDSVPEELEQSELDGDQFWAFYDDPF